MLFQIISYLKFYFKSTTKHGIHSPFVYRFTESCLGHKLDENNALYISYKSYKKALLKNTDSIMVNDFGAGSKIFKSNTRPISQIAKIAGISSVKAKLLIKIIRYFNPKSCLELGTSLGLSTLILSNQNNAKVSTIEGCINTLNLAKQQLNKFDSTSVKFYNNQFENILPQICNNNTFDLVYFDGNHQEAATLNYFNTCLNASHEDSLFIFDDIYLSPAMHKCWQKIIKHPKVTVSIDLFHFGLVFFRLAQPKQHFLIRTNS